MNKQNIYLQDKQYYIDRYDLLTIKECLDHVKMIRDVTKNVRNEPSFKNYPDSEIERNMSLFLGRTLFLVKAHRYKDRDTTISKWIEADSAKQNKLDNALPPQINCPSCGTSMVSDDFRHLEDWPEDKPMRVLFIFNCPKCKKRLGAYDNGEIRVSKPNLCPKCSKDLVVKGSRKGKVITTLYKCKHCSYSKKDILDLAKDDEEHKRWEEEQKIKEQENKKLLEKFRDEFCLSESEGKEYIECLEAIDVANAIYDEMLLEKDNPAQEKLMSLNKMPIADLEKVLNKAIVDSNFTNLSFGTPDIDRYVVVPFTIQDNNTKRNNSESIYELYDLFKDTLKDTNWRAPKDSLSYRLGFIKGNLKGYELDEDLLKLFSKDKPKQLKSRIDSNLREKHQFHSYVQLAKLSAEFEVEHRIHKRRLVNEPDGFFLNDGGKGYTCGICRNSHNGEDIWWREDGIRCRDCWRNIQDRVIPVLDLKKEWWEKEFLTKFDLEYHYGVRSTSIKKLRKEGVLVGRDLKDTNGHTYCTIYLTEENRGFLNEHPRLPDKYTITFSNNKKGDDISNT